MLVAASLALLAAFMFACASIGWAVLVGSAVAAIVAALALARRAGEQEQSERAVA